MVEHTDKIISTDSDCGNEVRNTSWAGAIPVKQGLYDPELEKDACGVGFAWYHPTSTAHTLDLELMGFLLATSKAKSVTRSLRMVILPSNLLWRPQTNITP
jgi:hypothetical protein